MILNNKAHKKYFIAHLKSCFKSPKDIIVKKYIAYLKSLISYQEGGWCRVRTVIEQNTRHRHRTFLYTHYDKIQDVGWFNWSHVQQLPCRRTHLTARKNHRFNDHRDALYSRSVCKADTSKLIRKL